MGTEVYVCLGKYKKNKPVISEYPFKSRSPELFKFLSQTENELLCLESDIGARKHRTRKFIDTFRKQYEIDERGGGGVRLAGGTHDHTVYVVSEMTCFDYDQNIKEFKKGKFVNAGKLTYRQNFPAEYFKLLEHCEKTGVEFVIFGYDGHP